jgi:RNA polymerase sigma-70 factor, ECF subfamily
MFDFHDCLRACAAGDRTSLKALYHEEAGRLIAVAQRIVRRRELAEEVVQEAFLQIWRKAASYNPELGSARAWIYTIVRNRALNVIRDGAREDLVDGNTLELLRDAQVGPGDVVSQLSRESRLRRCLEGLDAQKRESVVLSYVSGYSHGEIAGRLGVPIGTAKSWVRRGLLALRECMS